MPMGYTDFYDIATYGNENWKGSFTQKEIAQNAYDYLCEYRYSKANGNPTHIIKTLIENLREDNTEEALYWANQIEKGIGGK